MEIIDYSKEYIAPSCRPHSPIFPKNIFAIIAGSTGGGKTNLLINLLRKAKLLNYAHVYIYSSTLHQPAYECLKQFYLDLEKLIYDNEKKTVKIAQFFDADTEIMNPSKLDQSKNHIMVFDDVMMKDQSVIKDYFAGAGIIMSMYFICVSLCIRFQSTASERMQIFLYYSDKMTKL